MVEVEPANNPESERSDTSRAPRGGVRIMIIILAGLALVAIYANVQRARRDSIEKVIVIPFVPTTPAAEPTSR